MITSNRSSAEAQDSAEQAAGSDRPDEARAEALREQCQQVRQGLVEKVGDLKDRAEELFDWRGHLRAHPWAALGTAAAIGFLLAPRRASRAAPQAPEPAASPVEDSPATREDSPDFSAADLVVGFLGHLAAQAAIGFLGRQASHALRSWRIDPAHERTSQEVHP